MEIPILNLLYHFYTKFKKLPIYGRSILFLIRHWREIAVSFANRRMLISRVPMPGEKIVVVLFPAHPLRITGGLFVLLNLAMISREILSREGFKVVVAYPPHWWGLPCYPYYPNKEGIYAFSQIMRLFPSPDTLYIHVPECVATRIFKKQKSRGVRWIYSGYKSTCACNPGNAAPSVQGIQIVQFGGNSVHHIPGGHQPQQVCNFFRRRLGRLFLGTFFLWNCHLLRQESTVFSRRI